MRTIDGIVLHHSATPAELNTKDIDGKQRFLNICSHHQRNYVKRFPHYVCDYHFVVGPTGKVFKGQPIMYPGWHCGKYLINLNTIGVCLLGNFEETKPPTVQVEALISLLLKLVRDYEIASIKKHSDIVATLCPGKNFPFQVILNELTVRNASPYIREIKAAEEFLKATGIMNDFKQPVTGKRLAVIIARTIAYLTPRYCVSGKKHNTL